MNEDFKPLIRRFGKADTATLEDLWLCLARSIEDSLLEAGATPGKDYTILDLYKLAQPFALSMFEKPGGDITFTCEWPQDFRKRED